MTGSPPNSDAETFIRANLRLQPVAGVAEISIHTAHPESGLSRLGLAAPPYWAHAWAGGVALARHVLDHPAIATDRTVLDLGAGSALAGIAAALAGAAYVTAVEADPWGVAAARLNAIANNVAIDVRQARAESFVSPAPGVVLAGDVFYSQDAAGPMLDALDRFREAGAEVLVGDPGRRWLPRRRLEPVASLAVRDFGDPPGTLRPAGVFRLLPG